MMATEEYEALGIIAKGKLRIRERQHFERAMAEFEDGEVILHISRGTKDRLRSLRANRYYFGKVLKDIATETAHEAIDIHDAMRKKFLARIVSLVNKKSGEIEEVIVVGSTARLKPNEFADYVEKVRLWAAEFLGLTIEDPDPSWRST